MKNKNQYAHRKYEANGGGAPVTQHFSDEIGADGYRDNASAGVVLAKKLLNQNN